MFPRTAIYATVGPACRAPSALEGMIRAGAMALRIHGGLAGEEGIRWWGRAIQRAADAVGRDVRILLDLPGSGLRVGVPGGAREIHVGESLRLSAEGGLPPHTAGFTVPSLDALSTLAAGGDLALGDGRERLEVVAVGPDGLDLRVVEGGELRPGMSLHVRGASAPTLVPTPRDRALLRAGVEAGVKGVAQSFVERAEDVLALRRLVDRSMLVVAKIERVAALSDLDKIAWASDAVLIARGDLGVDAGLEQVPVLQRRILEACAHAGRPTILATGVLESMTDARRPSRAEVSDVASAVAAGVDVLMLTGETALGRDPARAVWTLSDIIHAAESGGLRRSDG